MDAPPVWGTQQPPSLSTCRGVPMAPSALPPVRGAGPNRSGPPLPDLGLLGVGAVVALAALMGGMTAQRLRQPALAGYLASGMVTGPYGVRLVGDPHQLEVIATIGVAFLMFALGVELSVRRLLRSGRAVLVTGAVGLGATVGLWSAAAWGLGWSFHEGMVFGYLASLASTAIVLKLLMERGEVESPHGAVLVGVCLLQDISIVPAMVLIGGVPSDPVVTDAGGFALAVGVALLKAVVLLGVLGLVGFVVVPRFLRETALRRSRELFVLTLFAFIMVTAAVSVAAGLSVALGAFVAGMVVSETDYSHQVLSDVAPLRDIFASFFFVSIGMLTDLGYARDNLILLLLVLGVLLIAKAAAPALALLALRFHIRTAFAVGAGLLPMGEFSFVLAAAAVAAGVASSQLLSLTIAAAMATMLLAPLAVVAADWLAKWLGPRVPVRAAPGPDVADPSTAERSPAHAVICGYGRTGRTVAELLRRRNLRSVVVDIDPIRVAAARSDGLTALFGDAGDARILRLAGAERARVVVVALSDQRAVAFAVRTAIEINPRADVVARVTDRAVLPDVVGHRNVELVEPGIEAGLEVIRHTLHRFGLSQREVQLILSGLRQGGGALQR